MVQNNQGKGMISTTIEVSQSLQRRRQDQERRQQGALSGRNVSMGSEAKVPAVITPSQERLRQPLSLSGEGRDLPLNIAKSERRGGTPLSQQSEGIDRKLTVSDQSSAARAGKPLSQQSPSQTVILVPGAPPIKRNFPADSTLPATSRIAQPSKTLPKTPKSSSKRANPAKASAFQASQVIAKAPKPQAERYNPATPASRITPSSNIALIPSSAGPGSSLVTETARRAITPPVNNQASRVQTASAKPFPSSGGSDFLATLVKVAFAAATVFALFCIFIL